MNQHLRSMDKIIIRVAGIVVLLLTWLSLKVLIDTFYDPVPLEINETEIKVDLEQSRALNDITVLSIYRKYTGFIEGDFIVSRSLISKNGYMMDIPAGTVSVNHGDNIFKSKFIIAPLAADDWCYRSTLMWRPTFSLAPHNHTLPEVCFTYPQPLTTKK